MKTSYNLNPAALGSATSLFWVRESEENVVEVPEMPGLNLLPPGIVPERILRKLSNEYKELMANPFRSEAASMEHYVRFGEECASRNLVPSFGLFQLWLEADRIGEV